MHFFYFLFFYRGEHLGKLNAIKCKLNGALMCTFPTLVQIYNILYLDSPLFPGSWPTIVLFTVALTEAHLGAVQIQSRANLLIPFFFCFFVVAHPFSSNSPLLVSLSTHFLEDHCPSRWRCEIFNSLCCLGDNTLWQMGHHRTDPNVCKSPYKAGLDVFNITQVPQARF